LNKLFKLHASARHPQDARFFCGDVCVLKTLAADTGPDCFSASSHHAGVEGACLRSQEVLPGGLCFGAACRRPGELTLCLGVGPDRQAKATVAAVGSMRPIFRILIQVVSIHR
jgi:hypothetical protein